MGCNGCGEPRVVPRKTAADYLGDVATETLPPLKKVEPPPAPPTAEMLVNMRRAVCERCDERVRDEEGKATKQRLYGQWDGKKYCGNPTAMGCATDPERFGNGLGINDQILTFDNACPRGHWGPGQRFYDTAITLPEPGTSPVLKGVIDFIGPSMTREGVMDCSGIGDVMVQGVVAQAMQRYHGEKGLRVRFITVEGRVEWAKIACPGIEVRSIKDPDRVPGEFTKHSAPMRLMEIDATCLKDGINRHQRWALEFGVPAEEVTRWEIPLDAVALGRADEYLSIPKKAGVPVVCVSPFANSLSRQWPLRHWVQLIHLLKAKKLAVFVIASPSHAKRLGSQKVFPTRMFTATDPQLVAAVLSKVDLVIGNDSGMCHIAGALRRPALTICAPTRGDVAFGGWPTVRHLQAEQDKIDEDAKSGERTTCSGCLWFKDDGWQPWCGYGCGLLADIKPPTVMPRVEEILRETGAIR